MKNKLKVWELEYEIRNKSFYLIKAQFPWFYQIVDGFTEVKN